MKKATYIIFIIATLSFISCDKKDSIKNNLSNSLIVAYIPGWSGPIDTAVLSPEKVSHYFYAFANIKDNKIYSELADDKENFTRLNALKKKNTNLKIVVSVGGWGWSDNFSEMASYDSTRKTFSSSVKSFLELHQIDGIDLDWEYPSLPGEGNPYKPEDANNFVLLVKQIRKDLDDLSLSTNKKYIITAATGGFIEAVNGINFKEANQYIDFINVMTYDLHNGWDSITGHHANLFKGEKDLKNYSGDLAIKQHIKAGIPAEKLLLGIAFYGRIWQGLSSSEDNGLLQQANTGGVGITYDSIKSLIKSDSNFIRYWDDKAKAPYILNSKDSIWISYEDTASISAKTEYAKSNNLKGVFFWEITQDKKEELLNQINK